MTISIHANAEYGRRHKDSRSFMLWMDKPLFDRVLDSLPSKTWFAAFAQRGGTYGIEVGISVSEAQSLVDKAIDG